MSRELWCLYESEIPDQFIPFLMTEEMRRIKKVGMHCGMEYTSFSFYKDLKEYSRYDHSLGVALIVYHFTKDLKAGLAGLFHDIATPTFAHVIDFLLGDYDKQEKTEEKTKNILENSKEIRNLLELYRISVDEVSEDCKYPIANNKSPRLSADRLEYTLNNLINYKFCAFQEVKKMYNDLVVSKNEEGEAELAFQHAEIAEKFGLVALRTSETYVTDEDRFGMEYLAGLLKEAIGRNVLTLKDLYRTEEEVFALLEKDKKSSEGLKSFRALEKVKITTPENGIQISTKKRYIDPLIVDKGRLSEISKKFREERDSFLNTSFDHYLAIA